MKTLLQPDDPQQDDRIATLEQCLATLEKQSADSETFLRVMLFRSANRYERGFNRR